MKVLYYMQPWSIHGGDGNVAHYLTEALIKKIHLTRFPDFNFSHPTNLFQIYKEFLTREFDIVHFNIAPSIIHYYFTSRWFDGNYFLLKYAKNFDSKTILNIHGVTLLEHDTPRQGRFVAGKTRVIVNASKKVDRIIINAEHMRSKVVSCYGVDNEKIRVIPNGIKLGIFRRQERRMFLSGNPAILFVGHICWVKGIDILLDAMSMLKISLPNAKLHLVGSEIENISRHSSARLLVKHKGLENHVVFHGVVPHSSIPNYYKSATICILPSRHEGFPIAMLEAMASGTPFISSDIASFQEILINGENALFFKSEDAISLSKAILKLCTDSTLREKIIQGASKTVAEYSWDRIAEKYISVYEDLCE